MKLHLRILLSLLIYSVFSCSNYGLVKESLTDATVSIPRLNGDEGEAGILRVKLVDLSFSQEIMNTKSQFNKEKTMLLPAIFYTSWHHTTSYKTGYDTFSGDLVNEFQNFVTTVLTDNKIKFVEKGEDFKISLEVDSFESKLTYHKKGSFLMLFYYFSSTTKDFSAVDSQIKAKLKIHAEDGDKIIPITSSYHGQNLSSSYSIEKVRLSLHHNLYDFSIKLMEELLNVQ